MLRFFSQKIECQNNWVTAKTKVINTKTFLLSFNKKDVLSPTRICPWITVAELFLYFCSVKTRLQRARTLFSLNRICCFYCENIFPFVMPQLIPGRILNRFSKDIGAIDEILPKALLETLQIFLVGAGILVMAFIVTPWLIVPTAIVTGMFYYTRKVYLASAQDVKRLEGTSTYLFLFKNKNLLVVKDKKREDF